VPRLPTIAGRTAAAAVTYNLGLCCHILGIDRKDDETLLDKAIRYYQTAYRLLDTTQIAGLREADARVSGLDKDNRDISLLSLIILNNMGHILQRRHEWGSVRQCLRVSHVSPGAELMMRVTRIVNNSANSTYLASTTVVPCVPIVLRAGLYPASDELRIHAASA
jgi:hypothetical protein